MSARAVLVASLVLLVAAPAAAEMSGGATDRELDFAARILPILTRHGCNGGACHGAGGGTGQNGFYLSLFGFEPVKDHARITEAVRGRFLDFAAPEESLLLQKPSGVYPHGGGIRLPRDSKDYQTLRDWIGAGAPLGDPQRHRLTAIEVEPTACRLAAGAEVRLTVTAVYADGDREDVTPWARLESNDAGIADLEKGPDAVVKAGSLPGDTAIVVLYRDKVATVPITIPRVGAPPPPFPAEVNFIDRLAFAKLAEMNISPSNRCDDSAFLRRLMIDVAGRLPTVDEAAAFLADSSPDKRERLIDRVLDSGDYATTFADKWVVLLRSNRDAAGRTATSSMHQWLRQAFQDNMPYDRFVREILTAGGAPGRTRPSAGGGRRPRSRTPNSPPMPPSGSRTRPRIRPCCSSASGWRVPSATSIRSTAGVRPTTTATRHSSPRSPSKSRLAVHWLGSSTSAATRGSDTPRPTSRSGRSRSTGNRSRSRQTRIRGSGSPTG